MTPLLVYGRFEVGRLLRSWRFLLITIGFPVTFYMLFLGDRSAGQVVGGTAWRVYLMVAMCSFGSLVAALTAGGARLSAERSSGWSRQLRVTPLPGWAYVGVKVTASMLVILPVIVLVEIVGATFGGVQLRAGTWVALTVVLWVAAIPYAVLGALIGFLVHAETAFPVVTALLFILGYFGGLFNPVSEMPGPLRTVARLLPSYHGAAVGLVTVAGHGALALHWGALAAYAVILGAVIVVRHRALEAHAGA